MFDWPFTRVVWARAPEKGHLGLYISETLHIKWDTATTWAGTVTLNKLEAPVQGCLTSRFSIVNSHQLFSLAPTLPRPASFSRRDDLELQKFASQRDPNQTFFEGSDISN